MQNHVGEHSYYCPICSKEFLQTANLHMHKLIHSRDQPISALNGIKVSTSQQMCSGTGLMDTTQSVLIWLREMVPREIPATLCIRTITAQMTETQEKGTSSFIFVLFVAGVWKPNLPSKHKVIRW